ncbi:TRAP transporter large permease subunit [Leucothrix arctica]|uniref:C4-dicarboxylate ABC transporter permease n=1 Tax=Leucothrix arctica TaxID=1481894 RepID=A0A317CI26_9GAMM|nr:TRAP transporter large permease subunit [Leucothrix arctica]PWQ95960.1 C4-dicarboxylate ABC transporter permease [Leucothrix arctica]
MEFLFLGILFGLMAFALISGYPVAFALPGSAIITIALAAACGYFIEGDINVYFAQDGPKQWLSAGVTNFRSLYWNVERDTLIAIPLFIFMGIMLQRSKIAEDLLVAMAQLFGPIPGGLGISVVFVGALLAATTGIVGATVIAMGLISLPAMLRNNYSKSLATGTICASGTLGQIIPPSIVLIILADQLSSAADQANTMRKELYREVTGEFSMPSQFDVVSASAGDMFMGALVPGAVLVGLYMLYILVVAWIKPSMAPPVPYDGEYDAKFLRNVLMALVPPLTLIFVVLGSILTGIATVNQAGSIGAVGAMIMAGYRLHSGGKSTYIPAIIAVIALAVISYMKINYDLNVKSIDDQEAQDAIYIAGWAVAALLFSAAWSAWRVYKVTNTLDEVMIETAKTTSMVFIILIGAAMLTSAFRAFGGEELVKDYLLGLPGGFWTQFLVVMLVIFLLGFFLDFIEIAVVVVPIVAPILLSNPEANITAVWLGVMVGLNIQTSFLTPPFGFALFYLRGVADKVIKTIDIYKGASAFICLQLLGLAIAGFYPVLVNYLPNRAYLLSENAPPPMNPKLQSCLTDYVIEEYASKEASVRSAIATAKALNVSYLPDNLQRSFGESMGEAETSFALMAKTADAREALNAYIPEYEPQHRSVRQVETDIKRLTRHIEESEEEIKSLQYESGDTTSEKAELEVAIEGYNAEKEVLSKSIPDTWADARKRFTDLNKGLTKAQREYYTVTDGAYEVTQNLSLVIAATPLLKDYQAELDGLKTTIESTTKDEAMDLIKASEKRLGDIKGASSIKSALSKARREIKKDDGEEGRGKAMGFYDKAQTAYSSEMAWRSKAEQELQPGLASYHESIATTIGLRSQERLTDSQAKQVAFCQSSHRDVSLNF